MSIFIELGNSPQTNGQINAAAKKAAERWLSPESKIQQFVGNRWEHVINQCLPNHFEYWRNQFPNKETYVKKHHESVDKLGTWGIINLELTDTLKQFPKEIREQWKSIKKLSSHEYTEEKFALTDLARFIVLVNDGRNDLISEWLESLIKAKNNLS